MNPYIFPLCIQLGAPASLQDEDFLATLELLHSLGFYGVELNLHDFEQMPPDAVTVLLERYGLKLTMLATGVYAKKHGLSLSSPDEAVRMRSVDAMCSTLIPYAKAAGCNIICGFIKGDTSGNMAQLQRSIEQIQSRIVTPGIDIYLEATNHYESAVVNRVQDGVPLLHEGWKVLPDTYHMNIEERSMAGALIANQSYYANLHISDNNRYFPGFGAIDFYQILQLLRSAAYSGTISIEGRNLGTLAEDIHFSCAYLQELSSRML